MATVIAEIRLAPGEVGYYDDYSRIYLSSARPTAKIYSDTNTVQIRRSIRSGRLRIVSGSLNAVPPQDPVIKAETRTVKKEVKPEKQEPAPEPVVEAAPIENETVTEPEMAVAMEVAEIPEEKATEEPVAEAPVKKRRTRKKVE